MSNTDHTKTPGETQELANSKKMSNTDNTKTPGVNPGAGE
jgi:hypothetical protein